MSHFHQLEIVDRGQFPKFTFTFDRINSLICIYLKLELLTHFLHPSDVRFNVKCQHKKMVALALSNPPQYIGL